MPIGVLGGAGGGAGGPAPNTVLRTTAFADRHSGTSVLTIARIEQDDDQKLPIPKDRVTVGEVEAIIDHVDQPAGRDFTTLHFAEPLDTEVEAGDIVRVDRLLHADVAGDDTNAAMVAPTGATQPTLRVNGASGGRFDVTFKTTNGQNVGAARNGTILTLNTNAALSGMSWDNELTEFDARLNVNPATLQRFHDLLAHDAGAYFTVSAIVGNANQAVSGNSWTFAGGVDGTSGSDLVILANVHQEIEVGDGAYFDEASGKPRRDIIAVTHDASATRLTLDHPVNFAYASGSAVRVERPIGYAQSVATFPDGVRGERGNAGPTVGTTLMQFARNNGPGAGTFMSIANGESDPRAGIAVTKAGKITNIHCALSYGGAGDTPTSGTTRVRLWNKDGDVAENLICEARISFDPVAANAHNGFMQMFTGTVATVAQANLTNAQQVTEIPVARGDVIVAEIEGYSNGLVGPSTFTLSVEVENEFTRTVRTQRANNPRAYFWFRGQTKRDSDTFPLTRIANQTWKRMQFNAGVDEHYDGGDTVYAGTILTSAQLSADIDPIAGDVTARVGIRLPAGRHDGFFVVESTGGDLQGAKAAFYNILSGGDADRVAGTTFDNSTLPATQDGERFSVAGWVRDIVADGEQQMWLGVKNLPAGTGVITFRGFAMFEQRSEA